MAESVTEPVTIGVVPDALDATGVVAIIRSSSRRFIPSVVDTLLEAGVRCIELTLTIPNAIEVFEDVRSRVSSDAELGVGTVTTAEDLAAAATAGARFAVTPIADLDLALRARELSLPIYIGGFTPTELLSAWNAGAAVVKLFPASLGGPMYLRRLKEPMPNLRIMPTGGLALGDIDEWIAAGAAAVGLGGALIGDSVAGGDLTDLRKRAHRALESVARSRGGHRGV